MHLRSHKKQEPAKPCQAKNMPFQWYVMVVPELRLTDNCAITIALCWAKMFLCQRWPRSDIIHYIFCLASQPENFGKGLNEKHVLNSKLFRCMMQLCFWPSIPLRALQGTHAIPVQGELWQPPVYEKSAEQKQQLRRVAQLQWTGAGQLGAIAHRTRDAP